MSAVVADTHAVVWLLFNPERLSPAGMTALQGAVENGDPIHDSTEKR